jgi:transcriptional regulator with XRE-family HTH domain
LGVGKLNLGEKIRHVRELRKYTLQELSELAGISSTYISDVENQRSNMSIKSLTKVAAALNVDKSYFLDEKATTLDTLAAIKGYELPEDIKEFVASEKSLPYIVMAKNLEDKGITADTVKMLVDHYLELINKR